MLPLTGYSKAKKYVDFHSKLSDREIIQLKKKYPGPCLTISRQCGIDVSKLCENLVKEFSIYYQSDWAYFDKQLIQKVLLDHNLPERVQKFFAEEKISTLSQMLNELLGIHPPLRKLFKDMMKTVLNLAEFGNVILVGRGSNIITAHLKNSYHIRLVASLDYRIANLSKLMKIKSDETRKIIIKEEKNRKEFISKNYHQNLENPLLYNMTIDIEKFTFNELLKQIKKSIQLKFPKSKIILKQKAIFKGVPKRRGQDYGE